MAEYLKMYEDCYAGGIYESFEELWDEFESATQNFGAFNWPVWVESYEGTLTVGLFFQRHGETAIWEAPATDEQVSHMRNACANFWIGRIDAGMPRR